MPVGGGAKRVIYAMAEVYRKTRFDLWFGRVGIFCTIVTLYFTIWPRQPISVNVPAPVDAVSIPPQEIDWQAEVKAWAFSPAAWFVASAVFYCVAAIIRWRAVRGPVFGELEALKKSHAKDMEGVSRVRLYQGRYPRPDLRDLVSRGGVVWIATHVAGRLCSEDLIKKPIERLILQNPESVSVDLLAAVVPDRTIEQLRQQIKLSIEVAERNGVAVKRFDGPMTSIIIGNPLEGKNGWAQIETFLPGIGANDRPSVFFEQRDFPDSFAALVRMFNKMWENPTADLPHNPCPNPEVHALTIKDRQSLGDRVIVTGFAVDPSKLRNVNASLILTLTVFNGACFKVAVGRRVSGRIQCNSQRLKDPPDALHESGIVLEHGGSGRIQFEQWLDADMKNALLLTIESNPIVEFNCNELRMGVEPETGREGSEAVHSLKIETYGRPLK